MTWFSAIFFVNFKSCWRLYTFRGQSIAISIKSRWVYVWSLKFKSRLSRLRLYLYVLHLRNCHARLIYLCLVVSELHRGWIQVKRISIVKVIVCIVKVIVCFWRLFLLFFDIRCLIFHLLKLLFGLALFSQPIFNSLKMIIHRFDFFFAIKKALNRFILFFITWIHLRQRWFF